MDKRLRGRLDSNKRALIKIFKKLITNSEKRDDNNNRVTSNSEMRDKQHKIKHCEINGQSSDTNIVFVETTSISFFSAADSRTEVFISHLISLCSLQIRAWVPRGGGGGALEYFLGGYVPPGTYPYLWHPVLKNISPKIDIPFWKWANFL